MKMNLKAILAIFSIFAMFASVFVVVPVVPIPTHAATSICITVPGSACITFGKNPEECRATFPPCHSVTHRQAALDTRDEIKACTTTFSSEGCKVIVKP
jgi:hypothetical protein